MIQLATIHVWEAASCRAFNGFNRVPSIARFFACVSRVGDGSVWYLLMLMLPIFYRTRGLVEGCLLALHGVMGTLVYRWIKQRTKRPRPCAVYASLTVTVSPLDRFSFPSGHTLHAVGFTVLASSFHPSLAWVLVPFTVLVGVSRLVLGLHYPSDVLVGMVIGIGTAAATLALMQMFSLTIR